MDIGAGFVCVDFRGNNHVVHVRLDYKVHTKGYGHHIEFTKIDTRDPRLLMRLRNPEVKRQILSFIINQMTGKLPPTAELTFPIDES